VDVTPDEFVQLCRDMLALDPPPTRVEAVGFVALFPAKGPRLAVDKAPDRADKEPDPRELTAEQRLEIELRAELEGR